MLKARGAIVVPFDEQAISGRDIYKRRVFLEQLARLDRKEADALAFYDMERLTRHELNRDAPLIAEVLIRNRALFVTWFRVYRVWLESDLQAFLQDSLYAGRDIRYRKLTMWRGIFGRAGQELMPMGKAPIGYRKRRDVVRKSNGRFAPHPELEKDPAQAKMMADLIAWLDECDSLAEVCRRMNRAGYLLESRRAKLKATGEVIRERGQAIVSWRAKTILRMFDNPYYVGEFDFGRFSKRTSSVWEGREEAQYARPAPELEYWTRAKLIVWRRKFSAADRPFKPQSRAKKYDRGLIGVLACVTCGRPMVSAGRLGYQCTTQRDGTCPKPQVVGQRGAMLALREILPDLLPKRVDLLESAQKAADTTRVENLEHAHRQLSMKQKADTAEWMAMPSPRPAELTQALQEQGVKLQELTDELELARANQLEDQQAIHQALGLLDHTLEAFDHLPESAQMELYRLLVGNVQIEAFGIARGRRWKVRPGYVARFRDNLANSPTASNSIYKLSFILLGSRGA